MLSLCDKANDKELDPRSLQRAEEEGGGGRAGRTAKQANRGSAPHEIRRFARKLDVISRQLGTEHTQACAHVHMYTLAHSHLYIHVHIHTHVYQPLINVRWELYRSWHRDEVQGRALSFRPPSQSYPFPLPLSRFSLLRIRPVSAVLVVECWVLAAREKGRFAAAASTDR